MHDQISCYQYSIYGLTICIIVPLGISQHSVNQLDRGVHGIVTVVEAQREMTISDVIVKIDMKIIELEESQAICLLSKKKEQQ